MARHPADVADDWITSFKGDALKDTLYAKMLVRPLKALTYLHDSPMPWKVRLSVLVTGVVPESYLENFDDRT